MVWLGDRGQAYSRHAEPFCLRLVSFLAGHVTSQQPWYGLGDRGQAYSRRAEPFYLRLVSFLAGHVTSQRPWYGLAGRQGTGLIQTG